MTEANYPERDLHYRQLITAWRKEAEKLAEALRVLAMDVRDRDPLCPNMLEAEYCLRSFESMRRGARIDGEADG